MISCAKESGRIVAHELPQASVMSHYIGQHYGGGIIFYLDSTGKHGLIAAASDFEEPSVWAFEDTLTGAGATRIGRGRMNTLTICKVQGDPVNEAEDYAALECKEFRDSLYKDWYLPSRDELNELYKQKNVVGGFRTFSYWSSSECNLTKAWFQNFGNGLQVKTDKQSAYAVRAIRYF